jgi:hypothetical protein
MVDCYAVATYVVVDTNQWERMPMLRHELAASLLFAIRSREDTFFALPEVVKAEVRKHLVDKCREAQGRMKAASGELRQIFGVAPDVEQYRDEEVDEALDERITELRSSLRVIEHSDDDLLAAAQMVMSYSPPNQKTQQFRDSVIWRIVLKLGQEHDVVFVTNDSGFYHGKSRDQLDPVLGEEAQQLRADVALFRDVESLLDHWGFKKPIPPELADEIKEHIAEAVAEAIKDAVADNGFSVRECIGDNITLYLTENPDRLAVSGDIEFELVDPEYSDVSEAPAVAMVVFTAAVDIHELDVEDVILERLHIDAVTPHGEFEIAHIQYVRDADHLGKHYRPFTVRKKLLVL